MTTGPTVPFVRCTPKGKEKKVAREHHRKHRVYYRAAQVEYSLHPKDFKVGLRLAVLEPRDQFKQKIPQPEFYAGTVTRLWGSNPDDPLVDIKYDAHPWALSITFGVRQNYQFCIRLPRDRSAFGDQHE